MKICFVTSGYFSHDKKFVELISDSGYQLDVFITKFWKLDDEEKISDVNYHYVKGFSFFPYYLNYIISFLIIFIRLKEYIKVEKPDILHGGNVQTAGFMCALTGYKPFLLMPYGSDIMIYPDKNSLIKKITNFVINSSSSITCDAEAVKNKILKLSSYSKEIVVFPWGVDLGIFKKTKESELRKNYGWENNFVLFCNRAHHKVYGIEYLILALNLIKEKISEVKLVLISFDYSERDVKILTQNYNDLIKKLNLEDYVQFIPPVTNDKMGALLNSIDVYVSTSLSDGTSVSLIEAMACGKPCVVTDLDANKEWIQNDKNGYIVPVKNIRAFSKSIIKIYNNLDLRFEMELNNLEAARKSCNWEKNGIKLFNLYEKLLING